MNQRNTIYRVAVSGLHCNSSSELVNLKVSALEGVHATSISSDHVLAVFADADLVSPNDIVRTLIDIGVAPDGEMLAAAVDEPIQVEIGTPEPPAAVRASLVQRIKVTVSDDYYPNRIEVIPGVPLDIEFSEGNGCLARVLFDEFEIDQDLSDGGAVVRLPGLTPGTHEFSCGMRMVHGSVVATI